MTRKNLDTSRSDYDAGLIFTVNSFTATIYYVVPGAYMNQAHILINSAPQGRLLSLGRKFLKRWIFLVNKSIVRHW